MGHATRSAAIIKKLIEQNNEIAIASDSESLLFLKESFPNCQHIELPSYDIRYSNALPFWLSFLIQLPKINGAIHAEKKQVDQFIGHQKFDLIISDNRFGCRHSQVKSILITHQINIQARFFLSRKLVNFFNHKYIHTFDEIWVPDDDRSSMSGKLSQGALSVPKKYIGIQSILSPPSIVSEMPPIDYLFILSGPEPSRSHFEQKILQKISHSKLAITLVGGSMQNDSLTSIAANIHYISFANHERLAELIQVSKAIVCRSGYSTLMDLAKMNYTGKVILVPTPGQTEQEYLAEFHSSKLNYTAYNEEIFLNNFENILH